LTHCNFALFFPVLPFFTQSIFKGVFVMTQFVLLAVLAAAAMDALQHSLIKATGDAVSMALIVAMMGGLVALPVLAATGLPHPAAFPWLVASIALGSLYWVVLGWAYQTHALAVVFPLSRGTAVLTTTLGATLFLGEALSQGQWLTVLTVFGGLAMIATHTTQGRLPVAALAPSFAVALVTSGFMLVDASGVRVSQSPAAYAAILYMGNAVGVGVYALFFQRDRLARFGAPLVIPALWTAALSLVTYILILFAMTRAPVAVVAALAETSIVFAALIGVLWLREPARMGHLAGIAMVASGVVVLRLTH
jgi:drug/metabolite transporter (DMT)-like permease